MRAVNLLPREIVGTGKQPATLRTAAPIVGAVLVPVIAIGLVVKGYSSAHSLVTSRSAALAAVQAELAAVPKTASATATPDYGTLVAERTQRRTALDAALASEVPWDRALADLARVLPSNVWLTDLKAAGPTTPAPAPVPGAAGGTAFTLTGYTYTNDDVAVLLTRLQLLPTLTSVSLTSTSKTSVGSKDVVQFTITADVSLPAGGAS
ncbi:MAG TPA: PilN domain-containing protein [Gaiellaceae bacterium]|nr:PilN domain-containing protein [Gaiellaceae bacterium]